MEWIADPSIWAGLVTLVVIELVLGIDNFGLYRYPRRKAAARPARPRADHRPAAGDGDAPAAAGLYLWLVTLTKPLIVFHDFSFSARDLIMLFGGLFLLFKATVELNERLEGKDSDNPTQRRGAKFWAVVAQIVVLDAIFSLDSVITAVGMVDHGGDDGRRGHRHQPDADGQQSPYALRQQPSDHRDPLSELPADDRLQPDC